MKLPKECPSCGYGGFLEVGNTLYQQEFTHTEEGEIIDWGDREDFPEGDEATHYECASCGRVVLDLQLEKTPEQIITEAIAEINLHAERLKAIRHHDYTFHLRLTDATDQLDEAEQKLDYARAELTGHLGSES